MNEYSDESQSFTLQVEMRDQAIIIRMEFQSGVLVETRFEGQDAYSKFLTHLKSISSGEGIHAVLHVVN